MAEDLSRMWDSFSLCEDEDVEMEIQQQAWEVGTLRGKSCLVGKLIVDRIVSKEIIRSTLLRGWKPEGNPVFKVLGDNMFLIELESEEDKKRVLQGRPWIMEGNLFAVEDYDGLSPPSRYLFDKAAFWVRIYNLPLACMSLIVGNQIGSSMGQVLEVDVDEGGMGWGECLRVKVLLDLQKPLSRGRKLKINGTSILTTFQYEKLSKFCFRCGVIKHGGTGCPERHDVRAQNATTQYGSWLRASSPTRKVGGQRPRAPSPTRRTERPQGRTSNKRGAPHFDSYEPEGDPRRQATTSRPENGRKSHHSTSDEEETAGFFQASKTRSSKEGDGGSSGVYQGDLENFHADMPLRKEGKAGRSSKEHKSKESQKSGICNNDGGAPRDPNTGFGSHKKPTGGYSYVETREGRDKQSPAPMGRGGAYSSPRGSFSGPVLADVEKSMTEAQGNSLTASRGDNGDSGKKIVTWKRKVRDDELNGVLSNAIDARKRKGLRPEGEKNSQKKEWSNTFNGSGLAEAGAQPRRPQ